MEKEDYYKTLELEENASQTDIKKAYRRLSLLYHPDKNPGKVDISGKFQKINSAYEVLGNEQSRMQYDAERRNPFIRMPGGGSGDSGIDELFANLFFGGMSPNAMHNQNGNMGNMGNMANMGNIPNMGMGMGFPFGNFFPPGANVKIFRNGVPVNVQKALEKPTPIIKTVEIFMEQVLNGGNIPVEVERWIIDNGHKVFETETLYVAIPKGIDDKEIILLSEKGNALSHDCKGDVKLFIKVTNNSAFKRQGLDLVLDKEISLKESLCGCSFELKHLNGKMYTINNTTGSIIKPEYKKIIPNMGLERDGHVGNIIICFHVLFPETLEPTAIEQLKEIL